MSTAGLWQKACVISNSLVITCLCDSVGATVMGSHSPEIVSMKDLHITQFEGAFGLSMKCFGKLTANRP